MSLSITKTVETYKLLKEYNGKNPYIIGLKNDVFVFHKDLNNFQIEYIEKNINTEPLLINKIVKIAKWYGEKKGEEWNLDFIPSKLLVGYFLGETSQFYHIYVKYRKSMDKFIPLFIPKKAVFTPLFVEPFENKIIDFSELEKHSGIKLKEHQEKAVKFLTTRKKGILSLQMGMGKEIDVNTVLPTPKGFIEAKYIRKGDILFSSNGEPTNVIGVYPQGEKDIYNIIFSDDEIANCGLEHLWTVKKYNSDKWEVKKFKDIINEGLTTINENGDKILKWEIPITKPVIYPMSTLPINPYILGSIISNGIYHDNEFYLSISKLNGVNQELLNNIDEYGNVKDDELNYYFTFNSKNIIKYFNNIIFNENLYISNIYLRSSIYQRKMLLMGYLDNKQDLKIQNKKIVFSIDTLSVGESLKELVESLGGLCTINDFGEIFELNIELPFNPFSNFVLKKDFENSIEDKNYCRRFIKGYEFSKKSNAVCFKVDSHDSTFLTENYVVTHNTISAIVASLVDEYKKILVICPASIKSNWANELALYVNKDDITIVEGSKWKENRYTIINYDILDNFYEIPTEIVKRKIKDIDDNGNVMYKTVEKEIISKKTKIIEESMNNSQLFQSKFDLIIIDEIHRLSNNSSIRYKVIMDLINRSNPKGIYGLTGTLISNNPMNFYNILKIIDADVCNDWTYYMKTFCGGKQIYVKSQRDKITKSFLRSKHKISWYDLTYNEKEELNNILEKNCKKIWITSDECENLDELQERTKHLYLRELTKDIEGMVKKETYTATYELNPIERKEYEEVWKNYVKSEKEKGNEKPNDFKSLIEGSILRQFVSEKMIPYTIKQAEEQIKKGNKVIIACNFDKELYAFKDYFGDKCVVYNGKMNRKEKDEAELKFKTDKNCICFIGNIIASGVGLNLTVANVVIFNSISYVPADNEQMEYRVLRIGQKKDCQIIYQKFNNTFLDHMFDILLKKQNIIENVIVDESKK